MTSEALNTKLNDNYPGVAEFLASIRTIEPRTIKLDHVVNPAVGLDLDYNPVIYSGHKKDTERVLKVFPSFDVLPTQSDQSYALAFPTLKYGVFLGGFDLSVLLALPKLDGWFKYGNTGTLRYYVTSLLTTPRVEDERNATSLLVEALENWESVISVPAKKLVYDF